MGTLVYDKGYSIVKRDRNLGARGLSHARVLPGWPLCRSGCAWTAGTIAIRDSSPPLVQSGLLTTAEATWDVMSDPVQRAAQNLPYEVRPADALAASELLPFSTGTQRYFMFQRRIRRWSKVASVKLDLGI